MFGAKRDGMTVRGYISTVTHCPFEGAVQPSQVLDVVRQLLDLGVDEISLGDTVGKAAPRDIRMLLDEIVPRIDRNRLSLHVHDTCGMAVANVLTAWTEYGIETVRHGCRGTRRVSVRARGVGETLRRKTWSMH